MCWRLNSCPLQEQQGLLMVKHFFIPYLFFFKILPFCFKALFVLKSIDDRWKFQFLPSLIIKKLKSMMLKLTTRSDAHILLYIYTNFPRTIKFMQNESKVHQSYSLNKLLSDTSVQCWTMSCYIKYSGKILIELAPLLEGKGNRRKEQVHKRTEY